MWTFGFFWNHIRNTGPVDGNFAWSYATVFIVVRLAVTATDQFFLHSLVTEGFESGHLSFVLFCVQIFAVCIHLENKAFQFVQYSCAKFV